MPENQFDFYTIEVSAPRITDLLTVGVKRGDIRKERNGVKTYGRKSYPVYVYRATVDFAEPGKTGSDYAESVRQSYTAQGVACSVRYHVRD